MSTSLFSYEQLEMWQLSMDFVTDIYKLLDDFPERERYALSSQIRRAAISVPSNIAEGTGRYSKKEKLHFNEISMGSLTEVMCQLEIANRVGYINVEELDSLRSKALRIGMMLSGYRRSIFKKMDEEKQRPTTNDQRITNNDQHERDL